MIHISPKATAFTVRRPLHSCNKRNGESSRGGRDCSERSGDLHSDRDSFPSRCHPFQCLHGTINVQLLSCLRPVFLHIFVWLLDLVSFCLCFLVCSLQFKIDLLPPRNSMIILLMNDDMDPAAKRMRKRSTRSKYNKLTKAQKLAILRYWGEKRLSIASITQHFSDEWGIQLSYRGVAEIISYWKTTGQIRGSKTSSSCRDIISELETMKTLAQTSQVRVDVETLQSYVTCEFRVDVNTRSVNTSSSSFGGLRNCVFARGMLQTHGATLFSRPIHSPSRSHLLRGYLSTHHVVLPCRSRSRG